MDRLTVIENSITAARKVKDRGESLERLMNNPDFKAVVMEGYLKQEAVRLAHYFGSGLATLDQKEEIVRDIHAVGALQAFFSKIWKDSAQAESDINAAEYQREEYYRDQRAGEPDEIDPSENHNGLGA